MNKILKEKIREALAAVLPIAVLVLILSVAVVPLPLDTLVLFLAGTVLLIFGMAFFSLGTDASMIPMGDGIGAQLPKTKNLWVVCGITLVIGLLITMAEPDLQVLADQVATVPSPVLIGCVAAGVGVFFVVALLRTLFRISLSKLLAVCYLLVFILSIFIPNEFVSVAFDSGGVTTGPITVPFIMAFGIGIASIRGDRGSQDDSFGLVALCSVGPILAVLLLGIWYGGSEASYTSVLIPSLSDTREAFFLFSSSFPAYLREVITALAPILLFCVLFQLMFRRFPKRQLMKIGVGFVYTLVGLTLFLTGVNVGFMPVGNYLGAQLAGSDHSWLLIPLGMVIGYFIVNAEPAVHVLNRQVEAITNGGISQKAMLRSLSIGVSVSLGLSMVRVLTGLSLYWFLVPGYALAIIMSFLGPKIFTGIAFDSGGVASGPMTTTFLLPFAMGACEALGGNILTDAFGIVAMVAMTPLLTIQALGLVYQHKQKKTASGAGPAGLPEDQDEIIELLGEGAPELQPAGDAPAPVKETDQDERTV